MKNLLILICILTLSGCNLLRPSERSDLTEYHVFVEVDGKPYEIKRTIQKWKTFSWNASQGSVTGFDSDYGIFGQRIHDNQAIVVSFSPSSGKLAWKDDEAKGIKFLDDADSLKRAYKILLLDHYKDPQVIEMYDSKEAFSSPDARVKVTGTTQKNIPKIPWWPFQGDPRDAYYDYALKKTKSPFKNSKKYFETRRYFSAQLTDKIIEKALLEFPELEQKGVYKLENSYRGKRIGKAIKKSDFCSKNITEDMCHSYMSKKINGKWMLTEKYLPLKVYYEPDPKENFYERNYQFKLNEKMLTFKNKPKYLNSFLNFDTKEYYGFGISYYVTREYKPK